MNSSLRKQYEDLLNPDVLRFRLICASIFIAGFEVLKQSVVNRIRDFFTIGFDLSEDKVDPKYNLDVLSRNRSPLYASLDWLQEMQAINNVDIKAFERVKECRNQLAHDLLSTLNGEGPLPQYEERFAEMLSLLRKIEVWWIQEVEIPCDPVFDGKDVPESEIQPGRCLIMQMLFDIALGDPQSSPAVLDKFRHHFGTEGAPQS